jgi:maltose alpha-D-glucosyltransferase / alpha-amylase
VSRTTSPEWYKDAIIYELHVRAFADSTGDGIGDFRGLIGKLDYLQGLGITAIWLLPFFPSPLRDDGYDISDYSSVHPAYGTLDDFRELLDEAHQRDLRVIIELVLNHTSDQHPWFQRARTAPPGSPERDFYVWSDSPERYSDARVIFQDYEQSNWTWDGVANAYFWHRFFSHQPDLNYDHPPVRKAMKETVEFWLDLGVDGLRLDAVPYLTEAEGTSGENLPGTHAFLKDLRAYIDARYDDRMLLAEANQWPEDAAAYFGDGDECHMAFHFPLMPRLFMALRTEDRLPVQDILAQTPEIPEASQWALFLRNHDELTLEMVTDEERLYMYHAFAPSEDARVNVGIRRRLAPLLGNSRRRIELMNALLCSLPGTPVLYYGDEIGMGDNIYLGDRDGVRTPMQWSADRNAGFSSASAQRLYLPLIVDYEYHHEAVHVEAQEGNPHSLLAFVKRLLFLRKQSPAFGRGDMIMLNPTNHRVLAFIREYDGERILVVANLSRFSQSVELDLGTYQGLVPVEMFGRIPFWEISDAPYPLTLGPHGFFWFRLTAAATLATGLAGGEGQTLPVLATNDRLADVVVDLERSQLERILPDIIGRQPWIRRSPDTMLTARLMDAIPLPHAQRPTWIVPTTVSYSDRDPETYLLVLSFVSDDENGEDGHSNAIPVARVQARNDGEAILVDDTGRGEHGVVNAIVRWMVESPDTPLPGAQGEVAVEWTQRDAGFQLPPADASVQPPIDDGENNPVFRSEQLVVKLLRRLNDGINPEWEIGQVLTEAGFPHVPAVLGALQYLRPNAPQVTIALLQDHVENEGTAWDMTSRFLDTLIHRASREGLVVSEPPALTATAMLEALGTRQERPESPLADSLDPWLDFARLLGERTANLHQTLGSITSRPAFAPEPYSGYDRRSLYQSMRGLTARTLRSLRNMTSRMDEEEQDLAANLLDHEHDIYTRLHGILDVETPGCRLRGHGDFHLGQVLMTGDDVVFIDFEGESDRFLEERRLKISPLRDVASMLHSFQRAGIDAIDRHEREPGQSAEQSESVTALVRTWGQFASVAYLEGYITAAEKDGFLPERTQDRATLIDALLFERAIYDLEYALSHHAEDVARSLKRISMLLGAPVRS